MKGKQKRLVSALVIIVIMLGLVYTAIFGLSVGDFYMPGVFNDPYNDGIVLGLDLQGGASLVFEANVKEDVTAEELDEGMKAIVAVLQKRADAKNFTEATVTRVGDKRVRVEIPSISNPDEAAKYLGSTGELKFVDADGNVFLTGKDVVSAKGKQYQKDAASAIQNVVALEFNKDAQKTFAENTKRIAAMSSEKDEEGNAKNYIKIMIDKEVISQANVSEEIDSNECIIEGNFTSASASQLASQISFGKIPFSLKIVESKTVGAVLGEKALSTSLIAGLIGIILVMLFMIVIYRLPGAVATIALIFYMSVIGILLVVFKVNLSLPGIAGIILSVGMAVDANVIIFERTKEELINGKTIRASVENGFGKAFRAILDSNITTIIAAVVLLWLGTGTIKSFAITLLIGVIVSMFTAIVITRALLRALIELKVVNPWLYGVKRGGATNEK